MADVLRSCSKTACRWPAAASLSYRYATRQVWLLDLSPTTDPSLYDLCPHHADALVIPKGWEKVDDRTVQEVMVEPSAFDRAAQAARRRSATAADVAEAAPPRPLVGAVAGRNRYAELVDQLPRLAAEAGVPGALPPQPATIHSAGFDAPRGGDAPAPAQPLREPVRAVPTPPVTAIATAAPVAPVAPTTPAAPAEPPLPPTTYQSPARPQPPASAPPAPASKDAAPAGHARPTMQHARSAPPIPSRELAPSPPEEATYAPQVTEPPLPGQLSMLADDAGDEPSGVVLPFELAGGRRRTPRS